MEIVSSLTRSYWHVHEYFLQVKCNYEEILLEMITVLTGNGGWPWKVRPWVWLVVARGVHVRNAVRRNTLLCWVIGGNLRKDHEPSGNWTYFIHKCLKTWAMHLRFEVAENCFSSVAKELVREKALCAGWFQQRVRSFHLILCICVCFLDCWKSYTLIVNSCNGAVISNLDTHGCEILFFVDNHI